jgi:membrane-associated PAP2 superfamily phosphatase
MSSHLIGFVKQHIVWPLAVILVLLPIFQYTQLDLWLAKHFYNSTLHQWPYRDDWLLQTIIHKKGRTAVYVFGIGMLLSWLVAYRKTSKLFPYRKALAFLVLAGISGPLVVTYLKSHTHIYCPWDLTLFGGTKPHVLLFDTIPNTLSVGHCFPAGHSSLGFTLVNFYFFFWLVNPSYKYYSLAMSLTIGLVFGITQQIRGAHFLSHDVVTLAICWFCSASVFLLFFRQQIANAYQTDNPAGADKLYSFYLGATSSSLDK